MDMGGAHLVARCQVRQGKRNRFVLRHQLQHAGIEAAHGVAQKAAQVRQAPAVIWQVGKKNGHGSSKNNGFTWESGLPSVLCI
ncbi:hypothetical protein D3C72_2388150 [compost metagenome]